MPFQLLRLDGGVKRATTEDLPTVVPLFESLGCNSQLIILQSEWIKLPSELNKASPNTSGTESRPQTTWFQHQPELAHPAWLLYTGNIDTACHQLPVFSPGVFTPTCDNPWDPYDLQFRSESLQSPSSTSATTTYELRQQESIPGNVPFTPHSLNTAPWPSATQDDDEDSDMDGMSLSPHKQDLTIRISNIPRQEIVKEASGDMDDSQYIFFRPKQDSPRLNKKRPQDPHRQNPSSKSGIPKGYQLRGVRTGLRLKIPEGAEGENGLKSRVAHNVVEKMYRTRLNTQFSNLLEVIPTEVTMLRFDGYAETTGGGGGGKVSKGDVLMLAKGYIQTLEESKRTLEQEVGESQAVISNLKAALIRSKSGDLG